MNIPYLTKCLGTNKLSIVAQVIDAPPIDMNLAIWDSIDRGEIEVDENKDRIKVLLKSVEPWHDPELASKMLRVIQHYAANEVNINKGRMDGYIKDAMTSQGYAWHEYVMSLQYLVDSGQIVEDVVSVPKNGDRPYHKFVFLCLPENDDKNAEWNAKQVNNWLENWKKSK